MTDTTIARGVRNRNPGNLDRGTVTWQGQADDQSSDPRFVVFKSANYGIRAIAKTLLTYQNHDGCKTIRQIITRWAPSVENNTAAYIAAVCAGVEVGPDDEVNADTSAVMTPLVNAIIAHENAGYVYPASVVADGIRMAGVADAPPKPLMAQGTFVTKVAGAGGLAVSGCVEACKSFIADPSKLHGLSDQVKDAAGQLDAFSGVAIFDHVKTAALTIGGGLLVASMALSVLKQRAA